MTLGSKTGSNVDGRSVKHCPEGVSLLIHSIHVCIVLNFVEHVLVLVLCHELNAASNIYEQCIRLSDVVNLYLSRLPLLRNE